MISEETTRLKQLKIPSILEIQKNYNNEWCNIFAEWTDKFLVRSYELSTTRIKERRMPIREIFGLLYWERKRPVVPSSWKRGSADVVDDESGDDEDDDG